MRKQTLFILATSLIIVLGALYYTNPTFFIKKSAWSSDNKVQIAAVNTSENSYFADEDWKKAFITSSTTLEKPKEVKTTVSKEPVTLTDKLGRSFFTNYMELKKNNLSNDEQYVNTVMGRTLDSTLEDANKPKEYTFSEIKVSDSLDNVSIRSYGNSVGRVFYNYGPRADPVEVAGNAIENNDMASLAKIKTVTSAYDKMLKAIIAIPAPRPTAIYHLGLVNGLSTMLFISKNLEKADNDPLLSMIAIGLYTDAQEKIRSSLFSMNKYFITNNVAFTGSEEGTLFSTVPQ